MPTPRLLVLAAVLAACGDAPPGLPAGAVESAVRAREAAPDVAVLTDAGPAPLAGYRGRTVVLLLAPPGHDAWAALDEARADLEASGAVVLAEPVGQALTEAARALGYAGAPLAVVVDGEGVLRGRTAPRSGDDLFALAAPVLAEAEVAQTVSWEGADTLDDLVAAGGVVVDLGEDGPPHALRLPLAELEAQSLPADLGTPLAFVGPDAAEAASRAAGWGYVSVYEAGPSGALRAVVAAPPAPSAWQPRSGGVRG